MNFKTALLAAATQAKDDGQLLPFQLLRIRFAVAFLPKKIEECKALTIENGIAAGLMKPGDANDDSAGFDWTTLIAFIKELLPLILEIIAIFKK